MSFHTLIFGAGWMGSLWAARSEGARLSKVDIADEAAVAAELDREQPVHVVNAAGRTGRPTVDALEGRPEDVYRSNVVGPLVLAAACRERSIHMTHLGSGCIYSGDNGGRGFGEEDPPNFRGSLYSRSKAVAEMGLRDFDVLQLRIRLPISATPHPRNLLTKILGYSRILCAPNSVTVLEDAWPVAEALVARRATGVWNLVNDGAERHDELLELYRRTVDANHAYEVVDEADLQLKAGRSNCILATGKLHEAGLAMPALEESLPRLVREYGARLAS